MIHMEKENSIKIFKDKKIRKKWDEDIEDYWYSVIDVIAVLIAKILENWGVLKTRLNDENSKTNPNN